VRTLQAKWTDARVGQRVGLANQGFVSVPRVRRLPIEFWMNAFMRLESRLGVTALTHGAGRNRKHCIQALAGRLICCIPGWAVLLTGTQGPRTVGAASTE